MYASFGGFGPGVGREKGLEKKKVFAFGIGMALMGWLVLAEPCQVHSIR